MQIPSDVIVALVTGCCSCIGLIITGIFQIRSSSKKRKADAEEASQKALNEANQKLEKQEQEQKERDFQQQIESVEESARDTQKDLKRLTTQVERLKDIMTDKASQSEESIKTITNILSKDARTRSNLHHIYARSEAQLRTLMEIETHNLKFAKDTADALTVIGELLNKLLTNADDKTMLKSALDDTREMQEELMDEILNAQKQFFEHSHMGYDNKDLEDEIATINGIVSRDIKSRMDNDEDTDDADTL